MRLSPEALQKLDFLKATFEYKEETERAAQEAQARRESKRQQFDPSHVYRNLRRPPVDEITLQPGESAADVLKVNEKNLRPVSLEGSDDPYWRAASPHSVSARNDAVTSKFIWRRSVPGFRGQR